MLTKPDAIPSGATQIKTFWLDVIEGRRFPLKLGYFCTRQLDEDERTAGVKHSGARDAEAKFFATTNPWATLTQQQRLGTLKLVDVLSIHLTKIIDDR